MTALGTYQHVSPPRIMRSKKSFSSPPISIPSAVIGGKLPLIHGYGKAGKGDDIVIEACEFSETFLKLTPYLSVVLNIDNDHLDYYGSMGELKFAFKRFALMTQFMIFANADDKNTMDVMYTLDRRVRTFGINNDGDYQAVNVQEYKPSSL